MKLAHNFCLYSRFAYPHQGVARSKESLYMASQKYQLLPWGPMTITSISSPIEWAREAGI